MSEAHGAETHQGTGRQRITVEIGGDLGWFAILVGRLCRRSWSAEQGKRQRRDQARRRFKCGRVHGDNIPWRGSDIH
jgi:hypothetical protein